MQELVRLSPIQEITLQPARSLLLDHRLQLRGVLVRPGESDISLLSVFEVQLRLLKELLPELNGPHGDGKVRRRSMALADISGAPPRTLVADHALLDHAHPPACFRQEVGSRDAGDAGADDHHIV